MEKSESIKTKKPTAIDEKLAWIEDKLTRIKFVDKMLFVHHLQIMVKAGLSIVAGLNILSEEIENKKLKRLVGEIKTEVEKGQELSVVLAKYPKVFPPIYVSMIAAGEAGGTLEDALNEVYIQMKKSHELSGRIRSAMMYPAVILIAMFGIAIEVVVFVLPKIMVMFEEFDAELPLATRVLIFITKSVQSYGIIIALAIAGLVALIIWLLKKPKIKRMAHAFNLKLPIAGPIIKKINLARFNLTLSSLLKSSIPVIEAMRITGDVLGNLIYREALQATADGLKKGEPLSQILANYPNIFPPMVTEMIMVGEETGQVEQMLGELSTYYSDEVDATMRNFSAIVEPVIILIMGLAVAGIAVAVIMPMYSLAQTF